MICPFHNGEMNLSVFEKTSSYQCDDIACNSDMFIVMYPDGETFKQCRLTLSNGKRYLIDIRLSDTQETSIYTPHPIDGDEEMIVSLPFEIHLPLTEESLNKILLLA